MSVPHERTALCVNADDLGLSAGVDHGIESLVAEGIVTSVSAFASPRALGVLARWREAYPAVSVGLHLTFAWDRDGRWAAVQACLQGRARLVDEVLAQHDRLAQVWGRPLSHLDAHQHVHALPPVRHALDEAAARRGVPWVRVPRSLGGSLKQRALSLAFAGVSSPIGFFGVDLMGHIRWEAVAAALDALEQEGCRRAVWMVHPGQVSDDHPSFDTLRAARTRELHALRAVADRLRQRVRLVPMQALVSAPPAP